MSKVHLGHDEIKLSPPLLHFLVLAEDGRLLVHLQVAVVHLGQRIPLVCCLWRDVFVDPRCHAPLSLQTTSVYGLLGLCPRRDAEF